MLGRIIPGTRVTGSDWNDIGEVKYLIVDPNSGQVTFLVVHTYSFEESCKVISIGVVSRLLDHGKYVTLGLTRDQVELLPNFDRDKYIGVTEMSRISNPILYNLKSRSFILPPSHDYLYPLTEELQILEAGQVNQFQPQAS